MTKKNKEKLWLRCVNLNIADDSEIEQFFNKIGKSEDLKMEIFGKVIYLTEFQDVEIPALDVFKEWHKEFMSIFQHRLKSKWLEENELKWLNDFPLQCRTTIYSYEWDTDDAPDEVAENQRYLVGIGLTKQPLQNFIIHQFNHFLESGKELRQCAASDCKRFFVPARKRQKWHDTKCQKRMWYQKNLSKKPKV